MKFEKKGEPKHTCYGGLKPGILFHNPGDEDIFLKTEDEGIAVHLQTGMLSGFSKDDEVIVVDGTLVWEDR